MKHMVYKSATQGKVIRYSVAGDRKEITYSFIGGSGGFLGGPMLVAMAMRSLHTGIAGYGGFVGGGNANNVVGGRFAAVVTGNTNNVNGNHSLILGGYLNNIASAYSSILGGRNNTMPAGYNSSFIAGSNIVLAGGVGVPGSFTRK